MIIACAGNRWSVASGKLLGSRCSMHWTHSHCNKYRSLVDNNRNGSISGSFVVVILCWIGLLMIDPVAFSGSTAGFRWYVCRFFLIVVHLDVHPEVDLIQQWITLMFTWKWIKSNSRSPGCSPGSGSNSTNPPPHE